jgi:hypothetical protein
VTLAGLFEGKTTMWEGVPEWAAVIVFFILMSVVVGLEGMIAFFVAKIPASERGDSVFAKKTCEPFSRVSNLPGFMIGRQLCVVSCMFFIARVTLNVDVDAGEETLWRLGRLAKVLQHRSSRCHHHDDCCARMAACGVGLPIAFLSNPFTYIFLASVSLEATGIALGPGFSLGSTRRCWLPAR